MGKNIKILLLFLLLMGFVGTAHAAIYNYASEIAVYGGGGTYNLTQISAAVNNTSVIRNDNGIWYLNKSIRLYDTGTTCVLSDADVKELRINGTSSVELYKSYWVIKNITLGTWNFSTNSYSAVGNQANAEFSNPYIKNCTFINFGRILTYNGGTIENLNLSGGGTGFVLTRYNNSIIRDIIITNKSGTGVSIYNCGNTTAYNINVDGIADYNNPSTGAHGIVVDRDSSLFWSDNVTVHDCYINSTGWSAFDCAYARNVVFYNLTIDHGGHNGVDIHGGENYTAWNITVNNSKTDSVLAMGQNCNFSDFHVSNPIGFNLFVERPNNSIFSDFAIGSDNACVVTDGQNNSFYNFTEEPGINSQFRYEKVNWAATDVKVIDFNLNIIDFYRSILGKSINCYPSSETFGIVSPVERTKYYYLDVAGKYANGSSVTGTITVSNSTYPSVDANGNNKTSFTMNGRTPLPTTRSTSAAMPAHYKNLSQAINTNVINSVNVSNGSAYVLLDNITPDSKWYRSNITQSKYTIVALFNDSANLHLKGYSPAPEYNNYVSGDTVKFQIWSNEPLTNVVWKKDGVEVQNSTAMTYETTVGAAPITVDITGSTATETVSKNWTIDPNQVVVPIPDPEPDPDPEDPPVDKYPPIANFTSNVTNGTIPLKVQFNDISENATAWYWDFDNNGKVDSTVRNATFTYRTQGNYTVKLTVSNTDGMNTTTKTEHIQAEKQAWYIIFWNWMFGVGGAIID